MPFETGAFKSLEAKKPVREENDKRGPKRKADDNNKEATDNSVQVGDAIQIDVEKLLKKVKTDDDNTKSNQNKSNNNKNNNNKSKDRQNNNNNKSDRQNINQRQPKERVPHHPKFNQSTKPDKTKATNDKGKEKQKGNERESNKNQQHSKQKQDKQDSSSKEKPEKADQTSAQATTQAPETAKELSPQEKKQIEDAKRKHKRDLQKRKRQNKRERGNDNNDTSILSTVTSDSESDHDDDKEQEQEQEQETSKGTGLTPFQEKLRSKLSGSRFRWINEQLYTTDGQDALKMMQDDPSMFEEYHTGFRSQASQWPKNPVDIIVEKLKSLPKRSLVVDLGCGEAKLAQELLTKDIKVSSYDLVPYNGWVVEAQCSKRLPLPGDSQTGQGTIVDAVVNCLSLMGNDWIGMVSEAYRILVKGGAFHVAEVASRFEDVDLFVKTIEDVGFKLKNKDTSNTHFFIFDFVKDKSKKQKNSEKVVETAKSLLKPCIYKRR